MKKLFSTLTIAAATLVASAQIPTTFNFQGVAEQKGEAIIVAFDINKVSATTIETVYSEDQTVMTNASGAFTAVIGAGNAISGEAWDAIDWEDGPYYVTVSVNGEALAVNAPLQAVPYANVARYYVGQDYVEQSIMDITEGNHENRLRINDLEAQVAECLTAVDYATSDVQGIQESLRGKANVEDVEALAEGLDITQEDVINLTEGNKENRAAIAILNESVDGLMEALMSEDGGQIPAIYESLTQAINRIETNSADIEALNDQMEYVSSDVQGIQESLRGKANVEDVEALAEGLDITQQDVINLTEGNKENRSAIAELQINVQSNGELVQAAGEAAYAAIEQIEALDEAIYNVSSDVQGIQESLRGKANVDVVEELAEGLTITQEDVMNLTTGNKENKAAIADLQINVQSNGELVQAAGEAAYAAIEQIEALTETVDNVSSDVQGIQETLRGKANVADVTELQDQMEIVSGDLQTVVESLRGKANVAEVEKLADGLDITQQDVMNLTEGNKANQAAIADLQAQVDQLNAILNSILEDANQDLPE